MRKRPAKRPGGNPVLAEFGKKRPVVIGDKREKARLKADSRETDHE